MMRTICSKFGTEDWGAEVETTEEMGLAAPLEGADAEATGVAGVCVQAANKTKIRSEKMDRFINLHVSL